MSVTVRVDREGDHASLAPTGPFDLAHATAVSRAVEASEARLSGCVLIDVDLARLDRIDGAGAVFFGKSRLSLSHKPGPWASRRNRRIHLEG